ncbi:hypothetical protein BCS42_06015 [Crenothrix sp. D3]|nr:hypothetical protein BCS42_06015 [Crenothrix sp. D3]
MKTLRLQIFADTQLRFFESDNATPKTRQLASTELTDFIHRCEQHYQDDTAPEKLGKELFTWLNGHESALADYSQNTLLQIPCTHKLNNLAWELLHNGDSYLCANQHQPFTPLRLVSEQKETVSVAQRQLRLLFMASSPENITPVLAFEKEESEILTATRKSNLELIVEESGSLIGLAERLSYGDDSERFDVVHFTGHADIKDGKPVFLLEDEFGQAQLADADAIASVFSRYGRYPRLLFLSGCKTAQASDKALPSLCEALVLAGLPAVLGWAKPVYDKVAIFTAQKLYETLADGVDLARAVALTRHALYVYEQQKQRDNPRYTPQWHYLRFYSNNTPLTALVIKGRRKPYRLTLPAFLGAYNKIRVCPRGEFVGRRRLLQQTLRLLRSQQDDEHYAAGVQLLGMGGLGKSSLAARVCQRLEQHLPTQFSHWGKIDEIALRSLFAKELPEQQTDINRILEQPTDLITRVHTLFNHVEALHSALFIFDDFEQNFPEDEFQRLDKAAYDIIHALLTVISHTGSASRVLITSRYQVTMPSALPLRPVELISLKDADLDKKTAALRLLCLQLDNKTPVSPLEQRAIQLGAGNPRLLERLYQVLACTDLPHDTLLANLEHTEEAFREQILLADLLSFQTPETRQLCAIVALFELFIPKQVLAAVFDNALLEPCLAAALAVGLIEVNEQRYFVSRLLLPLLTAEWEDLAAAHASTASPSKDWQSCIFAQAAECLSALWWDSDYDINEEEIRELIRVARAGERKDIFLTPAGVLADHLYAVSSYNEAHALYEELLPIQRELNDREGEGATLNYISQIYHAKGDYDSALHYLTESLKISQAIGDKKGEGAILSNISQIYYAKGDYDTALHYLTNSLKIQQAIGDKKGEGVTLNNISQIYKVKGDYDTTLRYLTDSLKIQQAIGDKNGKGTTLNNLAITAHAKGDYDTALRYLTDSLKITQAIGDKQREGATLNNISQIYKVKGDYDTALGYLTNSLKIQQDIGDKQGEGVTLNNISQIYQAKGDYDTALRYLTDSLKIMQDIGDSAGLCTTLFNMGHIHLQNDQQEQAIATWLQAYSIAKQIGLAQDLAALEDLAKQLGGEGLAYWETLSQTTAQHSDV